MSKHRTTKDRKQRRVRSGGFQDVFRGTTAIYVVERDGYVDFFVGDYEVDALQETWKEHVRADRLRRQQEGRAPAKLPRDSLRDQVLIAFGPEVSSQQAVAALEQAIESINANGLLIGTDRAGSIAWELTDGQIKV